MLISVYLRSSAAISLLASSFEAQRFDGADTGGAARGDQAGRHGDQQKAGRRHETRRRGPPARATHIANNPPNGANFKKAGHPRLAAGLIR